ncbi:TPA: DNA-binding protein [Escherichia coli]|nr:DNA-binding protein [Escherichia coli]MCS1281777.1 DNA-binding protein [Escherichia coli]HAW4135410.1 DNA-binding protein [Escherichia coli]HAW4145088.1 DNA-binding protein [Escherichia coli]HBB9767090.1 DNA-binding protein [Escherichia coli]
MSGITININVATPYVTLNKYAELTGIPVNTCKKMLADGRIIIRPKQGKMQKPEVNLIAMLKDAIANS